MRSFFVRWRSVRRYREFEFHADAELGATILVALEASGGARVWQAGTLWKCPGCGDRTVRTEEFLEGLRRAALTIGSEIARCRLDGDLESGSREEAVRWIDGVVAALFGCERDRVYINDADGECPFSGETYVSRI